jgi:flagellar biosynthetic protein FliR
MSIFNFSMPELMTFFAVLVRYSVLFVVLPFVGDHYVPTPVKILLSLAVSIALFPALVSSGEVRPADAIVWGASAGGIAATVAFEVIFGLILGYTAKLSFESINFGGNLIGNFMGYSIASTYDPSQQSQTQVVAQIQMAIAMLIFLVLDGHHLMLRAALESFKIVGVGGMAHFAQAGFNAGTSQKLIDMTSEVIRFGIELSAPIAIVLFGVNLIFGVMAKAMPQLNILVLSVTVTSFVGLIVMFLCVPEFQGAAGNVLTRMGDSMETLMRAMAAGK